MTKPTDQDDRDAIRTRVGEALFVEAGAGTGKTSALVARVVHMVATGHLGSMSQLVAITFTENAAAELRNRLRQALEPDEDGLFDTVDYDPTERARLVAGLATLDDAVLTTLHGFAPASCPRPRSKQASRRASASVPPVAATTRRGSRGRTSSISCWTTTACASTCCVR